MWPAVDMAGSWLARCCQGIVVVARVMRMVKMGVLRMVMGVARVLEGLI